MAASPCSSLMSELKKRPTGILELRHGESLDVEHRGQTKSTDTEGGFLVRPGKVGSRVEICDFEVSHQWLLKVAPATSEC